MKNRAAPAAKPLAHHLVMVVPLETHGVFLSGCDYNLKRPGRDDIFVTSDMMKVEVQAVQPPFSSRRSPCLHASPCTVKLQPPTGQRSPTRFVVPTVGSAPAPGTIAGRER